MILNFGSINVDYVYKLVHAPDAGETVHALSRSVYLGGKGINQSIAICRAGGSVSHIGTVGADGGWALDQIRQFGVSTDAIVEVDTATGHAIILLDQHGENRIVIDGGANQRFDESRIEEAIQSAQSRAGWVLLQNETNLAEHIVEMGRQAGLRIAYSAAPFVADVTLGLLERIDLLAVNEGEAQQLATALNAAPEEIPVPALLITRGASGSVFVADGMSTEQAAFPVKAVDTTGAGDTFLGSFLAKYADGATVASALEYASAASAIQVTREGAAPAIPKQSEVLQYLKSRVAE